MGGHHAVARDPTTPVPADPSDPFTCGPAAGSVFNKDSIYSTEMAAILRSPELKAAIIATLEADLGRFVGPRHASSNARSLLDNASMAVHAMAAPELRSDVERRAGALPALAPLVVAAQERFLNLEAPSMMTHQGLASSMVVARRLYQAHQQSNARLLSPQDMLGHVTRAAAVMSSLQQDYPDPSPKQQADLDISAAAFTNLLDVQVECCRDACEPLSGDRRAPNAPVLDYSRSGELPAALTTLEAIARLAAFLPKSFASDIPGSAVHRIEMLSVIAAWIMEALSLVPFDDNASLLDQEALDRIPGLVESCVKLALVAMQPKSQGSAAGAAYHAARLEFSNSMLTAAALLFERVALLLKAEPHMALEPDTLK